MFHCRKIDCSYSITSKIKMIEHVVVEHNAEFSPEFIRKIKCNNREHVAIKIKLLVIVK